MKSEISGEEKIQLAVGLKGLLEAVELLDIYEFGANSLDTPDLLNEKKLK